MNYKKQRLDKVMLERGLVLSRSQALNYVKLQAVFVNKKLVTKAGELVSDDDKIELRIDTQYVSRAGLKLASIAKDFKLNFAGKTVLDIGSSTGGFTDYALKHGARRVIAVDVGTNQLHPSLRTNPKVDLHEKTDIRDFALDESARPDIILMDVSFISVRKILPHLFSNLTKKSVQSPTQVVVMLKPQFETESKNLRSGVVKNSKLRREICHDFELWVRKYFKILAKRDSAVAGEKGNLERFYLLVKK